MRAKYIIILHSGVEIPIVFACYLLHLDVAGNRKVLSAGFCAIDKTGKWVVGGESVSLKISARIQDAAILNSFFKDAAISENVEHEDENAY